MPEKWLKGNTIIIGTTKSVILFYVFKLQTKKRKGGFVLNLISIFEHGPFP